MEWWVWLLLIIVVVLVLLAIWWWWRQTQQRQSPQSQWSSAPRTTSAAPAVPPATMPTEPLEALPAPAVAEANDLAVIEGIGPRIHDILNEAGIKTFAQLADTPVERIREILVAAELHVPANPSSWPAQARLAAESKWQELEELKASLKGGT
jgi:predicted flap endonuclease-1-like 5' DNA nuclease